MSTGSTMTGGCERYYTMLCARIEVLGENKIIVPIVLDFRRQRGPTREVGGWMEF